VVNLSDLQDSPKFSFKPQALGRPIDCYPVYFRLAFELFQNWRKRRDEPSPALTRRVLVLSCRGDDQTSLTLEQAEQLTTQELEAFAQGMLDTHPVLKQPSKKQTDSELERKANEDTIAYFERLVRYQVEKGIADNGRLFGPQPMPPIPDHVLHPPRNPMFDIEASLRDLINHSRQTREQLKSLYGAAQGLVAGFTAGAEATERHGARAMRVGKVAIAIALLAAVLPILWDMVKSDNTEKALIQIERQINSQRDADERANAQTIQALRELLDATRALQGRKPPQIHE